MRVIKKSIAALLCAAMVITLAPVDSADAAKKPSLKKKASVTVKQTVKIKVKNAKKSQKFTWKTSNKKVAKITKKVAKGKKASATIKGVKAGKANITATYKKGSKKVKLKCKVTVKNAVVTNNPTATPPVVQPTDTGGGTNVNETPAPTESGPIITDTPKPSPTPTNVPKNKAVEAVKVAEGSVVTVDGVEGRSEWVDAKGKEINVLANEYSIRGDKAAVEGKNITARLMWADDGLYAIVKSDVAMDEVKIFADVDGDTTNANAASATATLSADKLTAEAKVECAVTEDNGLKAEIQVKVGETTVNYFDSRSAMVYNEETNEFELKDEDIKAGTDDSVLGEVTLLAAILPAKEAYYTTEGADILSAAAIPDEWEAAPTADPETGDTPELTQKTKTMTFVDTSYWINAYGDNKSIDFPMVNTVGYSPLGDQDNSKITLATLGEDGTTYTTTRDNAQGYVMWDEDYIYVLFDITDPDISPSDIENPYISDSTEFFFNEDNDTAYSEGGSAVQLRVGARDNYFSSNDYSTGKYEMVAHAVAYKYADGVKSELTEGCTGYYTEYIIKLGSKHSAGDMMGMDLQVNDCYTKTVETEVTDDEGNTTTVPSEVTDRACTIIAYDTSNNAYQDPTVFGRVTLVKPGEVDEPENDDIVVPLSNHTIAGWITDATAVDNEDGSVTINYAKDGTFRGCAFKLDAPVDLSGYSKVIVDAEPSITDYDLCVSVLDATKKDQWNAEFAQGIRYGATFPVELALADIAAGETQDSEGNMVPGGDYSNIIGVSIFNGSSGKEQSVTIKSIKFVK